MATILELVQAACYEGNIAAPATLTGSSVDLSTLQLVHLTYATGRELRAARVWPQLKRRHYVDLEAGRSQYPLPEDFYAALPDTEYDPTTTYQLRSTTDAEWSAIAYSGCVGSIGYDFRVFGPDVNPTTGGGQFQVMPPPGASVTGAQLSFEYISSTWLLPTAWSHGATIALDDLRFSNGTIYKATVAGTTQAASTGYIGPTVTSRGVGQDGGVFWRAINLPEWTATTYYKAGQYVYESLGNFSYVATTGGVSGAVGPFGQGDAIVDGTVVWQFVSTPTSSPWDGLTSYPQGSYLQITPPPPGRVFRNVSPTVSAGQLTGTVVPLWTYDGIEPDGTVTWQAQTAPYDRIFADTDRCLFDDELMIAGLKWRFLRARGLEYRDLELEYSAHKDAAVSRFQPRTKISLAENGCWPCLPRVSGGSWVL